MAFALLRYKNHSLEHVSKSGIFIFDGEPANYAEWALRSRMRYEAAKEDEQKKAMSMIMEGLRQEASQVAMGVGIEGPYKPTGRKKLVEEVHKIVYP